MRNIDGRQQLLRIYGLMLFVWLTTFSIQHPVPNFRTAAFPCRASVKQMSQQIPCIGNHLDVLFMSYHQQNKLRAFKINGPNDPKLGYIWVDHHNMRNQWRWSLIWTPDSYHHNFMSHLIPLFKRCVNNFRTIKSTSTSTNITYAR
jgi:UDP:flavonoid glycosyltransferase YjiC (YdhE family)